jgi:uncharacterized damage-inducible protein DinB
MEENMSEIMYAKYNQAGNNTIYGILSKMSHEDREMARGSYYSSLSGLFRHVVGCTYYILSMFKDALKDNATASKAISSIENISLPGEGPLSESQWKELCAVLNTVDEAYINFTLALTRDDLSLPVKLDWYSGNPETVPLSFLLGQLLVHNTHHRGQISQILDSMKIDNDYSGVALEFMS